MRERKEVPEAPKDAVEAMMKCLEANMSRKAVIHRHKAAAAQKMAERMTPERRLVIREKRKEILSVTWGVGKRITKEEFSRRVSLGQCTSISERQYKAIINEACLSGIQPGQPFIHVSINRAYARYVEPISDFNGIRKILARHLCLSGKTILKSYNVERDAWVLYTTFNGKMRHVADVFGIDMAEFPEYVQAYVKPKDYRGPGRPRKPKVPREPKKRGRPRKPIPPDAKY